MIIGLVLNSPPGYSETFFRNKIGFLKEAGHEVIVFVDKSAVAETDYKIVEGFSLGGKRIRNIKKTIRAVKNLLGSPRKTFELYKSNERDGYTKKKNLLSLLSSAHILKFPLDWLHFGFATTALKRENLAKILGAKMAVSNRGYDIAVFPLKNPDCYRLLWKRADKLHYISNDLLKLAVGQGFQLKTPHRKITPAIDTNFFRGREFSSFGKPLKFLTVARLRWKKGLEYTLEALSLLHEKGIDFEYTIVGEGTDYERLAFAAYQLGIKEKVYFAGKQTPSEVAEIYRKSDVYLQYSIQEGFCNAVLEAQAMGLLCIVSDAEGLAENVLHEKTGWVVPKRNSELLAERILKVLNLSTTELTQISNTAMTRLGERFGLEKQREEFENFYKI